MQRAEKKMKFEYVKPFFLIYQTNSQLKKNRQVGFEDFWSLGELNCIYITHFKLIRLV